MLREARLRVRPRFAGTVTGLVQVASTGKMAPCQKWQAIIANNLDPPRIGYGDWEIHVGEAHVAGDPCTLLADPGDCSLERECAVNRKAA